MTDVYRRRFFLGTASVGAMVLVLASPGWGQSALAQAATGAVPLGGSNRGPEEIVVTAQRRAESLSKTPVAVSVVSSVTLQKRAIVSEKDLQIAVPGLLVRATQNSNQLNYALRGQSVDAFSFGNPAVLPYQNEVQTPSVAANAFYDLASVQVLKGPQGTLFGRNSTGGAVLFTTAKPTDTTSGFITARFGDYNEKNVTGALNIPIVKDVVLLRVAGFYENHTGYQYNLFDGSHPGEVDRSAGRATLTIRPFAQLENTTVVDYERSGGSSLASVVFSGYPPFSNPATPIQATGFYGPTLDEAFGIPGAFDAYLAAHPGADPNGLYAFVGEQHARGPYLVDVNNDPEHLSQSFTGTNTTTLDLLANTQVKNIFGFTYATSRDSADLDGSPYGVEFSNPLGFLNTQHQISDELQLLGKLLNDRLKYVVGGFFLQDHTQIGEASNFFDLLPFVAPQHVFYASNLSVNDLAAYAQGTYDLSDWIYKGLGVTAGVRYTSERNTENVIPGSTLYDFPVPGAQNRLTNLVDKLSYQFGVNEQLTDEILLYAVTRHSFRSAGFNAFAPPLPGFGDQGGAAFKPELATDGEIGLKYHGLIDRIPTSLNIALYREGVTDQQKTFEANLPGVGLVALTANVPKSVIQGFEFDGSVNPYSWLSLGAALNYTEASFTNNVVTIEGLTRDFGPYPDTPKWSGSVFADASFPAGALGTFDFRTDAYRQTSFYFGTLNNTSVPGTKLPAYTLVNFRLALDEIKHTGASIAFTLKNATNQVYYVGGIPTGGEFDTNSAIPGDPRTYAVELTYKF